MKKLGVVLVMVVSAAIMSVTTVSAQGNKSDGIPFPTNMRMLERQLKLSPTQYEDVAGIQEFFIEQQKRYLTGNVSPEARERRFQQVVFGNLKLMKENLNEDQYRRYVALINIVNYDRLKGASEPAEYLAMIQGRK